MAEVVNTRPHEAGHRGEGDEHSDDEYDSDDSKSNIYGSVSLANYDVELWLIVFHQVY